LSPQDEEEEEKDCFKASWHRYFETRVSEVEWILRLG